MLAQHRQDHDGGLLQPQQVGQHRQSFVHLLAGEGVGHLKDHRVDDGDGHRVDVLAGDPAVLGVGADFADLRDQPVHQVPAQEDEVLGIRGVDFMAQSPKAAADPVHQVTLPLAGELDHLAPLLDDPGQFPHPGVALVGHDVVDENQAAVVGQVGQDLGHGVPLPFRSLEEVIVLDHHQGPLAHHGQGVHGLPQALGSEGLALKLVVVELLHSPGNELGLHLLQIIVPQIGLLPVEEIEGAQGPLGQVLFQLAVGRLGAAFFPLPLFCHLWFLPVLGIDRHRSLAVGAIDLNFPLLQPLQQLRRRVAVGVVAHGDHHRLRLKGREQGWASGVLGAVVAGDEDLPVG